MNSKKGITLIALVITIIVLLILAGVTIATLTGDNGLLQKAGEAKNTTLEAEGLERIKLAVMASHDKDGINTISLAKNISQINGLTDTNNQAISENTEITLPIIINLNNNQYKINKDENVEEYKYYITDGLILHLDGIENTRNGHSSTTTIWEDLSGNNRNAELYNCIISNKNIEFNGTSSYGLLPNGSIGNWGVPTTIEVLANVENRAIIIADNPNNSNKGIATSQHNNKITQSIVKGNNFQLNSLFNSSVDLKNNTVLYTLIWDGENYSNTIAYTNTNSTEKLTETGGYSNDDDATSVTIGRRFYKGAGGWFLKGKIYSIRAYNRALTEEEIKNNYEVDRVRFNMD